MERDLKHISVILRAGCYFAAIICVNFGKEFVDVGAAKLMAFRWGDWLVLAFPTIGNCLITMVAYFDRSFSTHMQNGGAEKPLLTADEFKRLMADWKATSDTTMLAKKDLTPAPESTKVGP